MVFWIAPLSDGTCIALLMSHMPSWSTGMLSQIKTTRRSTVGWFRERRQKTAADSIFIGQWMSNAFPISIKLTFKEGAPLPSVSMGNKTQKYSQKVNTDYMLEMFQSCKTSTKTPRNCLSSQPPNDFQDTLPDPFVTDNVCCAMNPSIQYSTDYSPLIMSDTLCLSIFAHNFHALEVKKKKLRQ